MPGRRRRCRDTGRMRIVAGAWRGRSLVAPPGHGTRPTADRVRQALFDTLTHAQWGGRSTLDSAIVLDVFAGTGALGLEALSRGAASACFIENDAAALMALRANVATCKAERQVEIVATDVLGVGSVPSTRSVVPGLDPAVQPNAGRARSGLAMTVAANGGGVASLGGPASLVFLDPPYGQTYVPRALTRLSDAGRILPQALIVAETGRDETWLPDQPLLAERQYGAARILIFRAA
jgi:16S rRNA (guanine966-N2)-methyltransferase